MNVFSRISHWTKVRIRWASILVKRVIRFVTHDMWYLNLDDLSRWKARAVRDIKVIFLMLKVFADQKIGFQCTALAYQSMMSVVRVPDLMIYLRATIPHLVENIQKRGRDYEQQIQLEYLKNLNRLYDEFIYDHYPGKVLTVEVDDLDFLNRKADLAGIINSIDANLFGLF